MGGGGAGPSSSPPRLRQSLASSAACDGGCCGYCGAGARQRGSARWRARSVPRRRSVKRRVGCVGTPVEEKNGERAAGRCDMVAASASHHWGRGAVVLCL